ncbi:MAG: UDP-N-acetylglucosamine 1-carboxyvinyltransferase [Herpetosiphonaceae bacterium]|nr:MAG: UDP-N-acetylglucosamine 1-carboxyvinyltransferase [Herpetosiphonaceae bacterium]
MEAFVIEGGYRLNGSITPAGNKNAALPLLAASLLSSEPLTLRNIPDIGDVRTKRRILEGLGVVIDQDGPGVLRLNAASIGTQEPDPELCSRIRTSILLAGPLLARRGYVRLRRPGGDRIGPRPLDTHFLALRSLGASVEITPTDYELRTEGLRGTEIFLDEMSVTGTEQAILAAVMAEGTTIIANAASEPHVQDLCHCLNAMGARISGIGTNCLTIEGVSKLHSADFTIGPDYMEVGSFIGLAAVTGSELRIVGARPQEHRMTRIAFGKLGVTWYDEGDDIIVPAEQELVVRQGAHGAVPKIDDSPWPGFPSDLLSIALTVATQSRGTVLIHEKMFPSRLFFVDELISMGASIILCDPHRAVVVGRSQLYGERLNSPDIRAGMSLLIAALCAQGKSTIYNITQIDRGYAQIDERLAALGARIRRVTV